MYKEEITHYSECLSRDMHIMIYGHGGVPFLAFPTQNSLCHNYEEFGMIGELSDYLESLRGEMRYGKWFYGHLHGNRTMFGNHYLLYEQIVRIDG